jgi:phosphohistidine phosphatase
MDLLVIRHAIAIDRDDPRAPADDADRPLTRRGRRRLRSAVRGLARLGVGVDRVLHSPWTRAAETADLLGPIVEGDLAGARRATTLLTQSPRAELYTELAGLGGRAAVVGHQPWLGELIAALTVGAAHLGGALDLRKGGVAWLDGDPTPGGMRLRAFLPPRALRRIG